MTDHDIALREGYERGGLTSKGHRNFRMMKTFCILIMIMASQVYTFIKTHQMVYLKWVPFIIQKFYLNKLLIFFFKERVKFHSVIPNGRGSISPVSPKSTQRAQAGGGKFTA